jgi:hypothetical protein
MTSIYTSWAPGSPVQLPNGAAGVIDTAPAGDPIAPGRYLIDLCGPAVYVVWPAEVRGGRAGSWWRPRVLRPVQSGRSSR